MQVVGDQAERRGHYTRGDSLLTGDYVWIYPEYIENDGNQVSHGQTNYNMERQKSRINPIILDWNWLYQCELIIFNIVTEI